MVKCCNPSTQLIKVILFWTDNTHNLIYLAKCHLSQCNVLPLENHKHRSWVKITLAVSCISKTASNNYQYHNAASSGKRQQKKSAEYENSDKQYNTYGMLNCQQIWRRLRLSPVFVAGMKWREPVEWKPSSKHVRHVSPATSLCISETVSVLVTHTHTGKRILVDSGGIIGYFFNRVKRVPKFRTTRSK